MKDIEIGSYVKLKSEPTHIFRVLGINEFDAYVINKDGKQKIVNIPDLELGDDDDMLSFESDTPIFLDPKDF